MYGILELKKSFLNEKEICMSIKQESKSRTLVAGKFSLMVTKRIGTSV